jgi:hypothetical protein
MYQNVPQSTLRVELRSQNRFQPSLAPKYTGR